MRAVKLGRQIRMFVCGINRHMLPILWKMYGPLNFVAPTVLVISYGHRQMEMHAASDTIVLSTIAGRWIKATGRWMGRQTGAKQRIDGEQSSVAETYVEIGLTTFEFYSWV